MAIADIKVQLKEGTTTAPPNGSPGQGGSAWKQGKQADANGNYTVLSAYWYSYSGTNKSVQPGDPPATGGEVDIPDGGDFTVAPKSNEIINNVYPHETAAQNHYTVTPPQRNSKTWTVADIEHSDPPGKTDSFDVLVQDSASDPLVMCDPIIRNRGGN